jgi:hypothetical protein
VLICKQAFYPGMEGAKALATSMFGQSNRWGRLPYTIYPASWADANSILDHGALIFNLTVHNNMLVPSLSWQITMSHWNTAKQ